MSFLWQFEVLSDRALCMGLAVGRSLQPLPAPLTTWLSPPLVGLISSDYAYVKEISAASLAETALLRS